MVEMSNNVSNCMYCGTPLQSSEKISPLLVKCPNCGREIPIPKQVNEDVITKINLAHDKRNVHLFDEAYDRYYDIIKQDPNNTEAYWGLFLCDYGIVYVDDQVSGNYIPTMNRYLEQNIFDNRHYKKLIDCSDESQQTYYEEEATYIEAIRKEIEYHTSNQNEYDIFICYKKSVATEKGILETKESRYAKNIYTDLMEQGYENIFFAEETLKGNPGARWEALIYTALKTSKIMILMCSNDEYIRSAWVKNEWSRFLKLTEINRSKTIIPIRLDSFDFNRLPYRIRSFQGLDMQSTSFKDDLLKKTEEIIPILPEDSIQKKNINVLHSRKKIDRDTVEIVRRKIGNKNISEFKVTPSIEKEIENIKKIYIERNRFSKAIKRFNQLMEKHPDVEEVIWGKICATLHAQDETLETASFTDDIKDTLQDFELLMNIARTHSKRYISYYEDYLLRAIKSMSFDMIQHLFQYILSWKEPDDQLIFGKQVYETFKDSLKEYLEVMEDEKISKTMNNLVLSILEELTKVLPEEQNDLFFERYNGITSLYISYGLFTPAQQLIDIVLEVDSHNTKAIFHQGLVNQKAKGISEHEHLVLDSNIEPWFEQLLASGYDSYDVHHTILTSAITLLKEKKYKESFHTMDMIVSYFPESQYSILSHKLGRYCELLITDGLFEEANKYANYILSIEPTNSYAYWIKFKVRLHAKTNLDVLVNSKLELMEYTEFENALNADSDNKEILKFYDFDDELNENTPEMKEFKKVLKKYYPVFNSMAKDYDDLSRFNSVGYPMMKDDYQKIARTMKTIKKEMRSKFWIILIGIASAAVGYRLFKDIQELSFYQKEYNDFIISTINQLVGMTEYLLLIGTVWGLFFISNIKRGFKKIVMTPIKQTILYIIVFTVLLPAILSVPYALALSNNMSFLLLTVSIPILFIVIPFIVLYFLHYKTIFQDEYKHYKTYKKRFIYRQIFVIILLSVLLFLL